MENLNFINFMYLADLSILSLIDYLDSVEHKLVFSDKGQIYLDFSKQQKDILTVFIIENLLHAWQYGKKNILFSSCKPMLNWRQSQRNTGAIKSYKYKLLDNSIYIDLIKLNQFLDTIFKKLQKINLSSLKYNNILKFADITTFDIYKKNIIFLTFDNIDSHDVYILSQEVLKNIANCSYINASCNILRDGNDEYAHSSITNNKNILIDIIKQKFSDIHIL